MNPLNRQEFASALRKGQGRAVLHVREHGLDGVADLLLEACLHNQVYSKETESTRSGWLFSMFDSTAYFSQFREAILQALSSPGKPWDLRQLCWLAFQMADRGDVEAKGKVQEFAFQTMRTTDDDSWFQVSAALACLYLEGENGVRDIARIYGQRLLDNPDDEPYPKVLYHLDDYGFGLLDFKKILEDAGEDDPAIRRYYEYVTINGVWNLNDPISEELRNQERRNRRREFRKNYSVERLLEDARHQRQIKHNYYSRFGRSYAKTSELSQIFAALLDESDDETRTRLLWVFDGTPLPHLEPAIFEWANGTNPELRSAAIAALAQVEDDRVYRLAREKVISRALTGPDQGALDLFVNNYHEGDAEAIAKALMEIHPDDEDIHDLGHSIISLSSEYNDPDLAVLLKWVYEHTPCSFCRNSVIDDLGEYHALDAEMLYECQFDANDEIRDFVTEYQKTD